MVEVVYRIVEHDGGWAYKVGDVFSGTHPTRAAAEAAATQAAAEQRVPGETETISWQDEDGRWHEERETGSDRPNAYVAGADPLPATFFAEGRPPRPQPPLPFAHLLLAGVAGACLAVLIGWRRRSSR